MSDYFDKLKAQYDVMRERESRDIIEDGKSLGALRAELDAEVLRRDGEGGRGMNAWINAIDQEPPENVEVLTLSRHGQISGYYVKRTGEFCTYIYNDIKWVATHWRPLLPLPLSEGGEG